jgi:YidC/Oxa1 family membrane protein insertase
MRLIYTYTGAAVSGPENRYEKVTFDDMRERPLARDIQDGWIAVMQHYFVTAIVPAYSDRNYHYYTKALGGNLFAAGSITPAVQVAPGAEAEIVEHIYAGPKDQDRLAEIAAGLDLTVDYGMLWFIAKPLFWCLSQVHTITGNWGWSIVLITIFLKVLFYQLSAAGYRSMANMRRVQPRLMAIRDRYKDDRVRMNQAMMQLYKEEKINPFGGCLPILVQIPVFIALYWVLLESVELRQTGFVLWLRDLSAPDPYWVLPLIMGVTMFIQQKLNPAPMDPVQAKVLMVLPFVFTVFFGFFPSGLVLYWVVNNVLSIIQQWLIMRNLERAGLGPKPG